VTIRLATSDADYEAARGLIIEYATWLDEDFCVHRFDEEMQGIRTMYGPPGGVLLLARIDDEAVGCIGYRTLEPGVCEMKRLYVVPAARDRGIGRSLVDRLIAEARQAGFHSMVLDTIPKLATAHALYRKIGFVEIAPYYDNPIPDVTFMALELATAPTA
jgi:ribosomal protein S18 acetylase RimI-like enzyme